MSEQNNGQTPGGARDDAAANQNAGQDAMSQEAAGEEREAQGAAQESAQSPSQAKHGWWAKHDDGGRIGQNNQDPQTQDLQTQDPQTQGRETVAPFYQSAPTAETEAIQRDALQPNAAQHNAAQHNAAQHNAAQHNAAQQETAQQETAQQETAQHQLIAPLPIHPQRIQSPQAGSDGYRPGEPTQPPTQPQPFQAPSASEPNPRETQPLPRYGQYAGAQPFANPPATPPAGAPQPAYGQHAIGNQSPYEQPLAGDGGQGNGGYSGGYSGAFGTPTPPPGGGPKKNRKRYGAGVVVGGMVIAALIGGGAAAGTTAILASNPGSGVVQQSANSPVIVNNTDSVNAVTAAAQKASPSVVTIAVSSGNSGGSGSGIILDNSGNILTNTHVVTLDGKVANPTLQVKLNDGRVFTAKIVGTDPLNDLAVIKIDAPNLTPADLGDSSKLNVGDTVIAIGTPLQLSLSNTVTDGIVSANNRTISVASSAAPQQQPDSSGDGGNGGNGGFNFAPPDGSAPNTNAQGSISLNVIQTDAAINPGNSGGALVNSKGQVVGVNVAIASAGDSSSGTGGNIGVGFSIPINTAKRISQELITSGKASHGQLGVTVAPQAASGGATNSKGQSSSQFSVGAAVQSVTPGSAGEKAGLKAGDVITNFGSRIVEDASSLTAAVREQAANATVKVTFQRGGKSQSVDVTLDAAAN